MHLVEILQRLCVDLLVERAGLPPTVQSSQCSHVFFSQTEVKDLQSVLHTVT